MLIWLFFDHSTVAPARNAVSIRTAGSWCNIDVILA
jgi:hypothetical protein